MIRKTTIGLAVFLLFICLCGNARAGTKPTVTWYWQGATVSNGTTLSLNKLDTLVLTCKAKATNVNSGTSGTSVYIAAFVLTKGSVLSTYTATAAIASPAPNVAAATLTVSGGTVLYDSINGHSAGYDHIVISNYIVSLGLAPTNGYLTMYIPTVSSTDAGTYYCNYIDGFDVSSATATNGPLSFGASGSFTLTVTTKSSQAGAKSVSGSRSKALEYSLVLMGASKMLF